MLRSRRDVDRHVEQLEAKIASETERNLKALTFAKLYFSVREFEIAKKYLIKFLSVRENSSSALSLYGDVMDEMKQRGKALEAYRRAFEVDPAMTDVVRKACDLIARTGSHDKGAERFWLEHGARLFPDSSSVAKMKEFLGDATNGANFSPENDNARDDSFLWTAGSASKALRRLNLDESNSLFRDEAADSFGRSFSRPTPDRLAAQVSAVESRQSDLVAILIEQNKNVIEEIRTTRHCYLEELRNTRQNVVELKMEVKQGLHDLKMEMGRIGQDVKDHDVNILKEFKNASASQVNTASNYRDFNLSGLQSTLDALPKKLEAVLASRSVPAPAAPAAPAPSVAQHSVTMLDLQEALARQTAMIQMQSLGLYAARPQLTAVGPLMPPEAIPAMAPALPIVQKMPDLSAYTHPAAVTSSPLNAAEALVAQMAKANPLEPAAVDAQYRLNLAPAAAASKNLAQSPAATSPFKTQPSPAPVPVQHLPGNTTQLLSNIPPPLFSALEKLPVTTSSPSGATALSKPAQVEKPKTVVAPKQDAPKPVENLSSLDKFKPKAGSWECPGCFLRQDAGLIQCPACQTAKPGHEAAVKEASAPKPSPFGGFSFGVQPKTTQAQGSPFGGFSFNTAPAPANTTAPSGFSFQVPKPSPTPAAPAATSSPFALPKITAAAASTSTAVPAFSFAAATSSTPIPAAKGFSFGLAGTSGVVEVPKDGTLSFDGQSLKLDSEEDAKDMAKTIVETKPLNTLVLSGNTFGIGASKAIGKSLEGHPEFRNAHWKDMFTGRMKTEIPDALRYLGSGVIAAKAHLVELDLSDNAFGPIGMEGLADLLKSPSCYTLKELKLNNTGCGVTGGKSLAQCLLTCFEEGQKAGTPLALRVFVLGRSRQENEGATALANVFKRMRSLEEVVMPQNGIYPEGIQALMEAFSANPKLRILNLNDNTFTPKGAEALAKALPQLNCLTSLNIGDCLLKTEGAKKIAQALKEGHKDLEELVLDSNEIKFDGGKEIIDAIIDKPNLRTLGIGANQFGSSGCDRLLRTLSKYGKRDVIGDEIEDDEEPDDSEEEDGEEEEGEYEDDEEGAEDEEDEDGEDEDDDDDEAAEGEDEEEAQQPEVKADPPKDEKPFGSLFGGFASSSSFPSFGSLTPAKEEKPASGGGLFNSVAGPDFAALASNNSGGFAFGQKADSSFTFKGAGAVLFGGGSKVSPKKSGGDEAEGDEAGENEDNEHDPHFEPIIPLPELVEVTTGEEDEEIVFKHRAKVYRYDIDTKQWKERGVGDIKILKHPAKKTFRVLLRRDQIHKVACNHFITTDMELKPMFGSETAVCYFAQDYTDGELKTENLAVKFKLAETKDSFKEKFEACQKELSQANGA